METDKPPQNEFIAKKSSGLAALYIIVGTVIFIMSIALIISYTFLEGMPNLSILSGIILCPVSIISFFNGIYILKLPEYLIAINDSSIILLKERMEIKFADIDSILSRRYTGRGFSYSSGKIIIQTKYGEHRVKYVADVEDVVYILNKKLRGR